MSWDVNANRQANQRAGAEKARITRAFNQLGPAECKLLLDALCEVDAVA